MTTRVTKEKPGIVLVDLDATMAHYVGWKASGGKIGKLLPGVLETLRELRKAGHKVLVWTTRGDCPKVRYWLEENKVEYDGFFPAVKPMDLTLIIDDRCFRADNTGLNAAKVLESTTPAWKLHRGKGG